MKKCYVCLEEKDDIFFYKKGKRLQSKCKSCHNKYCIQRWKKRKHKAVTYKGGKCVECGYNKCVGALEFHHINPDEKDMDWNDMRKTSWSKIEKELDKCVLLCSNCHKEKHYN
jgi:5-methylcytosine-specific restriction endonuclease McrA